MLINKHSPNRMLLSSLTSTRDGLPFIDHALAACTLERPQGDDKTHSINAAGLAFFQSLLVNDVDGQQHLAATLMPQPAFDDEPEMATPIGRRLINFLLGVAGAGAAEVSAGSLQARYRGANTLDNTRHIYGHACP
jgi:hypothetical protein